MKILKVESWLSFSTDLSAVFSVFRRFFLDFASFQSRFHFLDDVVHIFDGCYFKRFFPSLSRLDLYIHIYILEREREGIEKS